MRVKELLKPHARPLPLWLVAFMTVVGKTPALWTPAFEQKLCSGGPDEWLAMAQDLATEITVAE